MNDEPCCAPSRDGGAAPETVAYSPAGSLPAMAAVEAGSFRMGTDHGRFPADREGPVREATTADYAIALTPVTNDDFAHFVDATGLTTFAESEGWSFVFGGLLPDDFPPTRGVVGAEWWRAVEGADWRHPFGPQSDLAGLGDHPVVHVTWQEAAAYAAWVGGRLPTETEWERAARGGLDQATFAWGDELTPGGESHCNIWQGTFPTDNTLDDGWYGTSPVATYPSNGFGLHDVAGNVWEWCADDFDGRPDHKVIKGGSYLCHDSYCNRYRVGARSSNTFDTSTGNMGFRVAS
ncbi:MAG: formylglycine-generating enzyme family protein [Acidimicrobiales bacterium]|nr:formylglycine-generating enzyme family protein [Acidimicrobiales bacterium]